MPPIGIVPDVAFPEIRLDLAGGALYVFSDGLTEVRNDDGEELGSAGVQRLIERFAAKPLAERVDAIVSAVAERHVRDDLTLLCVSAESTD